MTKKSAIILGSGSDIGCGVIERLRRDGWMVEETRHLFAPPPVEWDLVICCYGTTEPIGSIWDDLQEWQRAFEINLYRPINDVRRLYPRRRPGASVCFFAGAGTSGPAPTYSAYAVSKVALVKAVELLDDESPDCKFFIIGPGMIRTKLLHQALRAGARAANYDRVSNFLRGPLMRGADTSGDEAALDRVYECIMACAAAPKEAVGGRNICAHLDDYSRLAELADDPSMFKLRRYGDDRMRR